ncbi:hypothetical protein [Lewinella sp. LCG006]|uniref:DUF6962 family protein n=1 Tax=Lewinella sp. LCG006 TaxID=3231911 RepID=UPI00345F2073
MQAMDTILNPTVFVGNLEWREPVTTLTDFLVALVSLYAFIRFVNYKGEKSENYNYYKFYFLCFAISMTSAAWFGHGLQAYVSPEFKRIGWVGSATGLLFLAFASLMQLKEMVSERWYAVIRTLIVLQYLTFLVLMLHPQLSDFVYAQLSSTVSLVGFTLPMQAYYYLKSREQGSLILSLAILYGGIPGFVFNRQISLHRWLNYHDISHILMAFFMFFVFLGASRLAMKSRGTARQ